MVFSVELTILKPKKKLKLIKTQKPLTYSVGGGQTCLDLSQAACDAASEDRNIPSSAAELSTSTDDQIESVQPLFQLFVRLELELELDWRLGHKKYPPGHKKYPPKHC